MIGIERCEIMAMAAAEGGVLLEQAFVDVEAERLRLVVGIPGFDIGYRKLVDLAVFVEYVEQRLAAIFGLFSRAVLPATLLRS
jgi:hypothetical protein